MLRCVVWKECSQYENEIDLHAPIRLLPPEQAMTCHASPRVLYEAAS